MEAETVEPAISEGPMSADRVDPDKENDHWQDPWENSESFNSTSHNDWNCKKCESSAEDFEKFK